MNIELLKKHIGAYKNNLTKDNEKHTKDLAERKDRIGYYRSWTKDKILAMTEDDLYDYISKLCRGIGVKSLILTIGNMAGV